MRFATREVGYAFGPALFMTTDGGRSWRSQPGRPVAALETAGGDAVRVTYSHTGCPGPCDWAIDRAQVGTSDWRPVRIPPVDTHSSVQLVRHNRDVYAAFLGNPASGAEGQQMTLLVSADRGSTWVRRPDPCSRAGAIATAVAAGPGGVVAVLCTTRVAGASPYSMVMSSDRARTFSPPRRLPPIDAPSALAIAGRHDVLVANGAISGSGPFTYAVFTSHDGGRHWTATATEREPVDERLTDTMFLGFQTAHVGRWVGHPTTIWTTSDTGDHWTPRPQ